MPALIQRLDSNSDSSNDESDYDSEDDNDDFDDMPALKLPTTSYDRMSEEWSIQQEWLFPTPCFQQDTKTINAPKIPLKSYHL